MIFYTFITISCISLISGLLLTQSVYTNMDKTKAILDHMIARLSRSNRGKLKAAQKEYQSGYYLMFFISLLSILSSLGSIIGLLMMKYV